MPQQIALQKALARFAAEEHLSPLGRAFSNTVDEHPDPGGAALAHRR